MYNGNTYKKTHEKTIKIYVKLISVSIQAIPGNFWSPWSLFTLGAAEHINARAQYFTANLFQIT